MGHGDCFIRKMQTVSTLDTSYLSIYSTCTHAAFPTSHISVMVMRMRSGGSRRLPSRSDRLPRGPGSTPLQGTCASSREAAAPRYFVPNVHQQQIDSNNGQTPALHHRTLRRDGHARYARYASPEASHRCGPHWAPILLRHGLRMCASAAAGRAAGAPCGADSAGHTTDR